MCDNFVDSEWDNFCNNEHVTNNSTTKDSKLSSFNIDDDNDDNDYHHDIMNGETHGNSEGNKHNIPVCSPLNISTTTKIAYLNTSIVLNETFWRIKLIKYHEPGIGVVKKQMKFNTTSQEDLDKIIQCRNNYAYYDEYIISQINNPSGRIPFKDIRKLSFGLCNKDINSYRSKKKSAFYNCFVLILRLLINDRYKEIHVKVFNTGKLEIPGIKNTEMLNNVLDCLISVLKPHVTLPDDTIPLNYIASKSETVMINSNFTCGYYINREKMHNLIKSKYKMNSNYDPCSYPGIQCEFHYDNMLLIQNGNQPTIERTKTIEHEKTTEAIKTQIIKVSFMIFRTGSVLIVGKCSELVLYKIYDFLCDIFKTDYQEIKGINPIVKKSDMKDEKIRKIRKKMITV